MFFICFNANIQNEIVQENIYGSACIHSLARMLVYKKDKGTNGGSDLFSRYFTNRFMYH